MTLSKYTCFNKSQRPKNTFQLSPRVRWHPVVKVYTRQLSPKLIINQRRSNCIYREVLDSFYNLRKETLDDTTTNLPASFYLSYFKKTKLVLLNIRNAQSGFGLQSLRVAFTIISVFTYIYWWITIANNELVGNVSNIIRICTFKIMFNFNFC